MSLLETGMRRTGYNSIKIAKMIVHLAHLIVLEVYLFSVCTELVRHVTWREVKNRIMR